MLAPILRRAALIASRLTPGWNWPPQAFLLTYVLFFLTTLAFLRISRHSQLTTYKLAVGLSLFTGFALGWSNMVHISESENPLNFLYFTVLLFATAGLLFQSAYINSSMQR